MMDTVINYKGGWEAAYAIWLYLSTNPNNTLLIQHTCIKTADEEKCADHKKVEATLKWLEASEYNNYRYSEVSFVNESDVKSLGGILSSITKLIANTPNFKTVRYELIPDAISKRKVSINNISFMPRHLDRAAEHGIYREHRLYQETDGSTNVKAIMES